MRKGIFHLSLALLLSIVSLAGCSSSQSAQGPPPIGTQDEAGNYIVVEDMPELIGGLESLHRKIEYPDELRGTGTKGTVFIRFVVSEEGKTQNLEVLRSLHPAADEAAMRVVSGAQFIPGKHNGKAVPVRMGLPISFK